tara:strand:+ start:7 stop:777 length:771 start_codon:yes stop_codon:yes gene_type:complete
MLRDALPGVIRTLQAEEEAILPKMRRSVDNNEKSNKEVARLKKERNELRDKARPKLARLKQLRAAIDESGGMITLEPKWAKERLEEKITEIENKIETQALDHKAEGSLIAARSLLLKENEIWLQSRKESNPEVVEYIATRKEMSTLFKKADKKHAAMVELSEKGRPNYSKRITLEKEHREIRKQLDRAKELEMQSDASVKYWEEVVKNGFDKGAGYDLLQNSRRVGEGGVASFATKVKKRKAPKKGLKRTKDGEEE